MTTIKWFCIKLRKPIRKTKNRGRYLHGSRRNNKINVASNKRKEEMRQIQTQTIIMAHNDTRTHNAQLKSKGKEGKEEEEANDCN